MLKPPDWVEISADRLFIEVRRPKSEFVVTAGLASIACVFLVGMATTAVTNQLEVLELAAFAVMTMLCLGLLAAIAHSLLSKTVLVLDAEGLKVRTGLTRELIAIPLGELKVEVWTADSTGFLAGGIDLTVPNQRSRRLQLRSSVWIRRWDATTAELHWLQRLLAQAAMRPDDPASVLRAFAPRT